MKCHSLNLFPVPAYGFVVVCFGIFCVFILVWCFVSWFRLGFFVFLNRETERTGLPAQNQKGKKVSVFII